MHEIVCSNCRRAIGKAMKLGGAVGIVCSECIDFEDRWHYHEIARWYDALSEKAYAELIGKLNQHYNINYEPRRGGLRYGHTNGWFRYRVDTYYGIMKLAKLYQYDPEELWSRMPSLADINKLIRRHEAKEKKVVVK